MDMMTAPASFDMAPGFTDPVRESQLVFRGVMDALSRPGESRDLAIDLAPPMPLEPALAAIALALLDFETSFWLAEEASDARGWIRFHTGARVAASPGVADFVFVPAGMNQPPLETLALGSDEEPHRSTTLVIGVRELGRGTRYALSGPGIRDVAHLAVDGLGDDLIAGRAALAALFPRGIDVILTAGRKLAALPRTTRLES